MCNFIHTQIWKNRITEILNWINQINSPECVSEGDEGLMDHQYLAKMADNFIKVIKNLLQTRKPLKKRNFYIFKMYFKKLSKYI